MAQAHIEKSRLTRLRSRGDADDHAKMTSSMSSARRDLSEPLLSTQSPLFSHPHRHRQCAREGSKGALQVVKVLLGRPVEDAALDVELDVSPHHHEHGTTVHAHALTCGSRCVLQAITYLWFSLVSVFVFPLASSVGLRITLAFVALLRRTRVSEAS